MCVLQRTGPWVILTLLYAHTSMQRHLRLNIATPHDVDGMILHLSFTLQLFLWRVAWATTSCHWAKGRVHPAQVWVDLFAYSFSQCDTNSLGRILDPSQLERCWLVTDPLTSLWAEEAVFGQPGKSMYIEVVGTMGVAFFLFPCKRKRRRKRSS